MYKKTVIPSEDVEVVDFIFQYKKVNPTIFEGVYHHLGLNWRPYFDSNGSISDVRGFVDSLYILETEERKEFVAQVLYAILEGKGALERLLIAAFGEA